MVAFLAEPMSDLFTQSKSLILNFDEIPEGTPSEENIRTYFQECEARGLNPRLPLSRQRFNNKMLERTGARYLVSRYGEDRAPMLKGSVIDKEKRTIHLGVDIFCKDLEAVHAPCDGKIVVKNREDESHSFGNYVVFQPEDAPNLYLFLGHLSAELPEESTTFKRGETLARLGDFTLNENGGWSRHLHLQILKELPEAGEAPVGYSTKADLPANMDKFPDPMQYFPDWHVQ